MNNKSDDNINITIKISNTKDNNLILVGKSYYFNMKRSTPIQNLLEEFTKNFNEKQKTEINKYKLFTKNLIQMKNNYQIEDYFTNKYDSNLNIYDKDETIYYAILINI